MSSETISTSPILLFFLQILIFSLPPFYMVTLKQPLRAAAFYIYLSLVLVLGGFLGSVYAIPLSETVNISGGNLAYGALMYTAVLLVFVEGNVFAIRNVIRLVITVNILKYLFFSVFSWLLANSLILNPFNTAPDLFSVSAKFMIIGGTLIIVELLVLLYVLEPIKARVQNYYLLAAVSIICYSAILLLDGVLFPLLAFGSSPALVSIVIGGTTSKLILAAAYSVPMLAFLLVSQSRLRSYFDSPVALNHLFFTSYENLLAEVAQQQVSISETEQALQESEERLRLALTAANTGLYDLNLQTGEAKVNDQYALMLGYDPETFVETNANWIARLHPEDRERVVAYFDMYVNGRLPEYRLDFRQQTRTGGWVWIESLGQIVTTDDSGKPLRMVGTHTDITDRKNAEKALLASEAKYRNLVETSHDLIWAIDNEGRITFMNQASQRIYGRAPEEMIGQRYTDFVHPDQIEANANSFATAINNNDRITDFENWVLHKDGTPVCLSANAILLRDNQGNVIGSMGMSQDITAKKEADQKLRFQAFLLANVSEAIIATDSNFVITSWNRAAENLYGWQAEEVIGQELNQIIKTQYPDDDATAVSEQFSQTGSWQGEVIQNSRDGQALYILSSVTTLYDENGQSVGALAVNRDIGDRKQAEEKQKELLEQLQLAFQTARLGLWVLDLATDTLEWNDRLLTIYGITREQFIANIDGWRQQVHPDDAAYANSRLSEVLTGQPVYEVEFRIIQPGGQIRHINASATPIYNQAGELVKLIGINVDVTETKLREIALQKSQARLLQAQQIGHLGSWELDIAQNEFLWSEQIYDILGVTPDTIVPSYEALAAFAHPEDQARVRAAQEAAQHRGVPLDIEYRIVREDGRIRHVHVRTQHTNNTNGEPYQLVGTLQDITDRKLAEIELRQRNQFIETILDNLPIGLAVNFIDQGTASYMNDEFAHIYGWPKETLANIDQFFLNVYPDPDYRQQIQSRIMADIESGHVDRMSWDRIKITTQHGEERIVTAKNIPIYDQNFMISTVQNITARVQAEEALRQQEAFLSNLVENAPVSIYAFGADDRARLVNQIWEADTGHPRAIALGRRIDQMFSAEVAAKFAADNKHVIETGSVLSVVENIEGRYFHTVKAPVPNAAGIIDGIVGISVDVSEREQVKLQLQAAAQRLETLHQIDRAILAQDSPQQIAEVTIQHLAALISCDLIGAAWFGEEEDESFLLAAYVKEGTHIQVEAKERLETAKYLLNHLAKGQLLRLSDLSHYQGRSEAIDKLVENGIRSYMLVPLFGGDQLVGSLTLGATETAYFNDNHELFVQEVANQLAIALHQTHLHQAEQAQRVLAETLQETAETLVGTVNLEKTLEAILNQLSLVIHYDLAQVLLIQEDRLLVGARHSDLRNWTPDVAGERPYTQIPLLNQSLQKGVPIVLSGAQIQEAPSMLPGINPALKSWIGIPLIARDVAIGFLTIGNDESIYTPREVRAITAFAHQAALAIEKATILSELENNINMLQKTQAQMVRAARLSAIGETAAGVAHQINNPLTTVILDSYLLLKKLPEEHPARPSADAIHQSALRAASVVERLLDFSRTMPTNKTRLDIATSIREAIPILQSQLPPHIHLSLALPSDLPLVEASSEHLQDVWLNLLLNARDAVKEQEIGEIRVTAVYNPHNHAVEVAISDNGVGIPVDQQRLIFNPFYTTKPRGTGLGLAVCQDIVSHHDGEIVVSSTPGEGTIFTVVLPV